MGKIGAKGYLRPNGKVTAMSYLKSIWKIAHESLLSLLIGVLEKVTSGQLEKITTNV